MTASPVYSEYERATRDFARHMIIRAHNDLQFISLAAPKSGPVVDGIKKIADLVMEDLDAATAECHRISDLALGDAYNFNTRDTALKCIMDVAAVLDVCVHVHTLEAVE